MTAPWATLPSGPAATSIRAAPPVLVAVAHGTRCRTGQEQVRQLVDAIRRRRPGLRIELAYLDIEQPGLGAVARGLDRPAVAVPLLFAAGYHVRTDIPAELRGTTVTAAAPLGPDPLLTEALVRRLREAGPLPDAVVLAAAGSSDPRARADVRAVARELATAIDRPVRAGYASAATPRVDAAVASLRGDGARRVGVAAMLLADGHFHRSLHTAGADTVTRPLGTTVVDLILSRYHDALTPVRRAG
ncbi:MAG: sirohydrochlorin chelatase [Micromonosporaceae bacterium]